MEVLVQQCEDLLSTFFSQIHAIPLISPKNKKFAVPSLRLVRRKQDRLYADPIVLVEITQADLLEMFSLESEFFGSIISRSASEELVGVPELAGTHSHCMFAVSSGMFSVTPVNRSKSHNFVLKSGELQEVDVSLWRNLYEFVASGEIKEP